jgi:hypothetical protein
VSRRFAELVSSWQGYEGVYVTGTYTPTITQAGQTFSSISASWFRIGGLMVVRGTATLAAATAVSAHITITLPTGVTPLGASGVAQYYDPASTPVNFSSALEVNGSNLRTLNANARTASAGGVGGTFDFVAFVLVY